MDRVEAMNLVGSKRIHPVTLSRKFKRPIPGTGGTVHECVRVSGACSISAAGFVESYGHAWITGYDQATEMWLGADEFATWPLAQELTTSEGES